jgi:hypothetical protein
MAALGVLTFRFFHTKMKGKQETKEPGRLEGAQEDEIIVRLARESPKEAELWDAQELGWRFKHLNEFFLANIRPLDRGADPGHLHIACYRLFPYEEVKLSLQPQRFPVERLARRQPNGWLELVARMYVSRVDTLLPLIRADCEKHLNLTMRAEFYARGTQNGALATWFRQRARELGSADGSADAPVTRTGRVADPGRGGRPRRPDFWLDLAVV